MTNPVKISAIVISYNEENNIGRCLDSLMDTADEIIVVDSYSSDTTGEICKEKGVDFIQHPFEGHIEQKNYALSCASSDYVLALDADEALSDTLIDSIRDARENWHADGYTVNRSTNYCGKWIHGPGIGNIVDEDGRFWLVHHGYVPVPRATRYDPRHRMVFKLPLRVAIDPARPMHKWITPVLPEEQP